MKKLVPVFYCFLLSFIPSLVFSQKTFISIGGELALPGSSSGLALNANTGYGGSLQVESKWGKHISGLATLGYLSFAEKQTYSFVNTTAMVNALLIQGGIKYYTQERKEKPGGFFISAEAGVMRTKTHFDYESNPDFDFKESGLSCAPGIGYLLWNIEPGFRVQYNLTASGFNAYYYNFRLVYAFLKKKK